jgi:isopentenyl phosphate kinase
MGGWDLTAITAALNVDLMPVIFGDVIFDSIRGGTIFSTEDLFDHLARILHPKRILLAGIESGVWADYPACHHLLDEVTPALYQEVQRAVKGSTATDVTGGMASKVRQSLDLVQALPDLEILIFSGEKAGNVAKALIGENFGTCIKNK